VGETEIDAERDERVLHPVPARRGLGDGAVLGFTASREVGEVEREGVSAGGELPVSDGGAFGVEGGGDDGALVEVEAGVERSGGRHGSRRLVRGTSP
jgi:hypothetical protein